jgi:hypothetical protein
VTTRTMGLSRVRRAPTSLRHAAILLDARGRHLQLGPSAPKFTERTPPTSMSPKQVESPIILACATSFDAGASSL